jgi:ATP-dependent DNA helicase RecG
MNKAELLEIIASGESSGVEFKRDNIPIQDLAREIVAFANYQGGMILLGVEDDGTISGIQRQNIEEWVMQACRTKVEPEIIPYYETVALDNGKRVAIVRISSGPAKPYAMLRHGHRYYYIRAGSTVREAGREELLRLFQASGRVTVDLQPVPGATLADLDQRRLRQYFEDILEQRISEQDDELCRLLETVDLMTQPNGMSIPTVAGMLLFGKDVKRFLPQAGIRAVAYPGKEKDYAVIDDEILRGPMLPLLEKNREGLVERGLVEQAEDFTRRNIGVKAYLDLGRRMEKRDYPLDVVREIIVNALVHRDYTIAGTDIMLAIYSDRLEITSPGRLPNTVTIEGIKRGQRYARNQILVYIMRDYGYVEYRGMGITSKVIPGMLKHNGTEPDLIEDEYSFTVRLWREGSGDR